VDINNVNFVLTLVGIIYLHVGRGLKMNEQLAKALGTAAIWGGGAAIISISPAHTIGALVAIVIATIAVWF
jgi:hypothetical protein